MASRKGWWLLSLSISRLFARAKGSIYHNWHMSYSVISCNEITSKSMYNCLSMPCAFTNSLEFKGCSCLPISILFFFHVHFVSFLLTDAWFDLQMNEMLEEKMQPYIQNIDKEVLSEPILLKPKKQDKVFFLPFSVCVSYPGFTFVDCACWLG